jgi:hypothetical protein
MPNELKLEFGETEVARSEVRGRWPLLMAAVPTSIGAALCWYHAKPIVPTVLFAGVSALAWSQYLLDFRPSRQPSALLVVTTRRLWWKDFLGENDVRLSDITGLHLIPGHDGDGGEILIELHDDEKSIKSLGASKYHCEWIKKHIPIRKTLVLPRKSDAV